MKNLKKKIKPAILTEEEIIKLFKTPYDKNDAWYKKLKNADDETVKKMIRFMRVYPNERNIDNLIHSFTLAETSDEDFVDEARWVKNHSKGQILEIKRMINNVGFELKTKKGSMKIVKAYEYFTELSKFMPLMDQEKRDGKCHWHAMEFSTLLSIAGIENEVVSAYVYEYAKKQEYSHSWVEFRSDIGNDLVFDGNRGVIMTRDGYYQIKHPHDIYRISHKDIVCEQTIIKQLSKIAKSWANKLYFHDREMALRVYEQYYGKPFVPKNYEECINNPSIICVLDDKNKENKFQPEK